MLIQICLVFNFWTKKKLILNLDEVVKWEWLISMVLHELLLAVALW